MYGIEALMRRTTPVEDEGVQKHSLYKTRGGAYVAVFGKRAGGMDVMFLHKGTSNINVSPGVRFTVDEAGRYEPPAPSSLDLMTRIPYDALDAL